MSLLALLRKEFILELRRKSMMAGLALYLLSIIFICYLAFSLKGNTISELTWGALFWITVLFCAVNTVAKSFIAERPGVDIYLYSIADPHDIILSKIIYNFFLCTIASFASLGLFVLFFGNPLANVKLFFVVLLLASYGFSASLSLLSAIASRAQNSNILMPVLSFPVVIGILLLVVKLTRNCIDGLDTSISTSDLLTLGAVDALLTASSYILFPFAWRS